MQKQDFVAARDMTVGGESSKRCGAVGDQPREGAALAASGDVRNDHARRVHAEARGTDGPPAGGLRCDSNAGRAHVAASGVVGRSYGITIVRAGRDGAVAVRPKLATEAFYPDSLAASRIAPESVNQSSTGREKCSTARSSSASRAPLGGCLQALSRRADEPLGPNTVCVSASTSVDQPGTSQSTICRHFEAAEGTRTLDLLHGKQTL
jgi:hypothetical protein